MRYYEDPILGKGRAADVSGGTGSADYVGGTRIAIAGETISFVNSATIQNVTGNSVTLEPDTAYKITATASAVTLNANVPAAGSWAYEGHAEIFVAGTGYIVTGANVVLANPLEPDAVNNCVLRFHDGTCIIDVEDHVYGYIVTSISGTTQGTLPYGITSASQEYIAFDATTNGSTIDLSGSTASAEKHLVGNGYTSTTLTGAVDCGTSKFTVANLGLSNVQVTGGVMTLGDAFIPSGSTVAVNGGGLAVEKVTVDGGLNCSGAVAVENNARIDGSGTITAFNVGLIQTKTVNISNVTITGTNGNMISPGAGATVNMDGVTISGNVGSSYIMTAVQSNGVINMSNCKVVDNVNGDYGVFLAQASATINLRDCELGSNQNVSLAGGAAKLVFAGENQFGGKFVVSSGSVIFSSGAVLDLTGNTNATPIAPGGGVVVDGGCQVITSAGSTVSIAGGAYSKINNDGTTE